MLHACGAEASALQPLFKQEPDGVQYLNIKGRQATLDLGQKLADRYDQTGYWPIIAGCEDGLEMMREMAEGQSFSKILQKAIELAKQQYEFCIDIVEQGRETIDALAIGLCQCNQWFFWWD